MRLINFLKVRIDENIFLYPTQLIFPSIIYHKKLDKVKLKTPNKKIIKNSFSGRILIDHGIVKAEIQDNWLLDSSDEEISYLPRRLFWLIYELTKLNNPNITLLDNYLNKFISYFYDSNYIKYLPPYILSECISNIILFNRAKNKSWIIKDNFHNNFAILACKSLVSNIEFRGSFSTCNHLINNFRALYLSSRLIQRNKDNSFFLVFWEKIKKKVFIKSGKIADGSVHYHFLITRWLFEICICAYELNDYEILNKVNPYLKSNLEIVGYLSRADVLPLFGDLSPDCPVEWLLPIANYVKESCPYSAVGNGTKGWDRIWSFENF
ncbi:MAG: hypothetical protein JJ840_07555 [Prochlorococcus marinus CUG1431]|uniref:Uncharacterized protein n=1 Tax=Prochlorococcus marinus CUG1433 TaxID=2774506 RepID=A0A9D9G3R7_PROMR|nr:hypothetical protein [Prochlorococcus marinus CUG1433]MBO6981202.1 hypothetical protein [Prochlorococcus marinus CUG1431]